MKEITVPATTEHLPRVIKFVETDIKDAALNARAKHSILIAIDEVFNNVVNYAYSPETGDITIRVLTDNRGVTLEFEDGGIEFNPLDAPEPDISSRKTAEEREIGGLGIFMLRRLTDTAAYKRVGGKNILTLTIAVGDRKR